MLQRLRIPGIVLDSCALYPTVASFSKANGSFINKLHPRCFSVLKNEEIKASTIRLVQICKDTKKKTWNIVSRAEALRLAKSEGLDLVLVSSESDPPVCKLESFNLVMLAQKGKEKVQRANQRSNTTKEMLLTLGIDPHDFETKMNRIKDFVEDGHQVKITVVLFKKGFRKVLQHAQRVGNSKAAPIMDINEMTKLIYHVTNELPVSVRQNDVCVEKFVEGVDDEEDTMSEVLSKREFYLTVKVQQQQHQQANKKKSVEAGASR